MTDHASNFCENGNKRDQGPESGTEEKGGSVLDPNPRGVLHSRDPMQENTNVQKESRYAATDTVEFS